VGSVFATVQSAAMGGYGAVVVNGIAQGLGAASGVTAVVRRAARL
jgi:hypothetical protein